MPRVLEEAKRWECQLAGIELPWLCWNVDSDWCVIQQRLVREVGWTPVVGFDPRVGPPPLVSGAVLIDFNERFRLPTMWMHFPLEFIFLMCDRLAFWHADCLIRIEKMQRIAAMFAAMPDGEAAAVMPLEGWRDRFRSQFQRYWEVVGCNTRGASRSQFENGCGWWMNFAHHPSNSAQERRRRERRFYWDSGAGVRFWHNHCGGKVHLLPEREIEEGHFSAVRMGNYTRVTPKNFKRDLSRELSLNTDLARACCALGLDRLLAGSGEYFACGSGDGGNVR